MQVALTIAGSDSMGGAGIQADIKAFASLGVHGATVITAVTAQNTQRVVDIMPLQIGEILSQLDAVLEDADVASAKTGMLYSPEIVSAISRRLEKECFPLVVDPVMTAGVGGDLGTKDLADALKKYMVPISTIITPNRPEAEAMVDFSIESRNDLERACRTLNEMGARSVLIKGGHFEGEFSVDILFVDGRFYELSSPRVGIKGHGGGCTISAYIAACLAKGMNVREAVVESKHRIFDAIRAHYDVGKGATVMNPLASMTKEVDRYETMIRLRRSIKELITVLPATWVPEVGTNFAYALPYANSSTDICAMDGRIINVSGYPKQTGDVSFGASRYVAAAVLAAMQFDPQIRSAMNVKYSEEHVQCFESAGLMVGSFERGKELKTDSILDRGALEVIKRTGTVPDMIFDKGSVAKEPMIRILGRGPEDVVMKLKLALS